MASSKHLRIPLKKIDFATDEFAPRNCIGGGGYGKVYRGISEKYGLIAVKRLSPRRGQGDDEFKTEIDLLSKCDHKNIVSLVGFCEEDEEKILVYRYERKGSLNKHLNDRSLSWVQRLLICHRTALALDYLHSGVGRHKAVILHLDVKSSNILLGDNWEPKISDFGLSMVAPVNVQPQVHGTEGYTDPDYSSSRLPTPKSDVYSFGVVLWEVLCGRLARRDLATTSQKCYIDGTLHSIIPLYLQEQIQIRSLLTFTCIAYRCLRNQEERPTMKEVVKHLQQAYDNQINAPPPMQQFVLRVSIPSCDNCVTVIRRCLIGFDGVENVTTNCNTHEIVVEGQNADPMKVQQRLSNRIKRDVKLVSPSVGV